MVDLETPPAKAPGGSTRSAALWAAGFALPVAILAGVLLFWRLAPGDEPAAKPTPTSSAVQSVPSTPVQMAAPKLSAQDAQICLAVTSQLPNQVRNLPARKVSAGPEQNAAYGDPPITVSCGVAQPTLCEKTTGGHPGCVPLTANLLVMNNVCWYGEDGPATKIFTTMDREVPVRVAIPASYDQAAEWANEFSDAVFTTVKSKATDVPAGCTS
jgi:Protein of unknown function (DUF3515)